MAGRRTLVCDPVAAESARDAASTCTAIAPRASFDARLGLASSNGGRRATKPRTARSTLRPPVTPRWFTVNAEATDCTFHPSVSGPAAVVTVKLRSPNNPATGLPSRLHRGTDARDDNDRLTDATPPQCSLCGATDGWLASGRPLARRQGRPTPFACQSCARAATRRDDTVPACTFCGHTEQTGRRTVRASLCADCATTALTAAQSHRPD